MQLIEQLNLIISEKHLLKHAYYQAWSRGELSLDALQSYAAQYYHQVKSFPRFISRVHTFCPEIEARKLLLENLVDEEIHGVDHPSLWMQFAEGLGAKKDIVLREAAIDETQTLVDQYYHLAQRDWCDGLCALYAYEYQVPDVSASKIAGLKEFYGITDDKTLEFFTAHQVYDVDHSTKVAHLIEKYADPEKSKIAVQEASDALWKFLDGMCRIQGIACH